MKLIFELTNRTISPQDKGHNEAKIEHLKGPLSTEKQSCT
jgi:hypothetical protein